jgi:hypothetical protein
MFYSNFIQAIHDKRMIELSFRSKEDGGRILVRKCAPMDFGPSRRAREKNDRFHVWDYESDTANHVLSLSPEQVTSITVLNETFEPADFVMWKPDWLIRRNWGMYS